jgi:DNA uptake protein ComE-like DNA-binding protein
VDIERAPLKTAPFVVDLNQADWPELTLLPGVSETLARRIVASRNELGPFRQPPDLLRVPGIGPQLLRRIEPHLMLPLLDGDATAGNRVSRPGADAPGVK